MAATHRILSSALVVSAALAARAQQPAPEQMHQDSVTRVLVARLQLESYKATIKGLTQFGDRRQGTDRNRNAVDWIEAQFKKYGCTEIGRIKYEFTGQQVKPGAATRTSRWSDRPERKGYPVRGVQTLTSVNMDPMKQPDTAIRRIDMQPDTPGPREEVYCTKVGTVHPDQMYILGGHMDGHGYGQAANDDGSGTALVMEVARVLLAPDVKTDISIRFVLWNNEETGLNGSSAYVAQRKDLQGKEEPAGSGKYPEPKWLGMIQHDMMLFDHGMPKPDGTMSKEQRPEADVNIEFAGASTLAPESQKLAWFFRAANDRFALDYPAAVGDRMSNTDSDPFKDITPSISLRENERLAQIGTGWDPQWHQVTDVYTTYADKDFLLGLNAAETTLSAIALLTNANLK
jgi:hypothetical protein